MRRTRRSHVRFNGQSHFEWCVAIVPRCNLRGNPRSRRCRSLHTNIVTGERDALAKVLAADDDVDALWVLGSQEASTAAERLSVGNLKRTLVDHGLALD